MSLLMKALEKAAKDRGETAGEPPSPVGAAPATAVSMPELELEPVALHAPEPAPAARSTPATAARERAASARAAARGPAQAATVIRAGQTDGKQSVLGYLRDRPLVAFGALAGLFIIGFGSYVYIEIMNPALFASKPPPRPPQVAQTQPPVPPAPPGANPAAAPVVTAAAVAAAPAQAQPLTSLLPPGPGAAEKDKAAPPAPATLAAAGATASKPAAPTSGATPAAAPAAGPSSAAAGAAMPRDTIKITAATQAPTVNPVLADAYNALNTGALDNAQKLYGQILKSDPRNTDALLGLAAIATQQGDRDAAMQRYIKVIEFDPRNSLAQAGLLNVLGSADPLSAETRVKQLISRDPNSAFLYFTLGNTYIDQTRWGDAQQAFFQAHHLQPDNPDYAYNLAIALEHIGQRKSALDFYRRAVQLAAAKGHSNFSPDAVLARVNKLEKIVQ